MLNLAMGQMLHMVAEQPCRTSSGIFVGIHPYVRLNFKISVPNIYVNYYRQVKLLDAS